MPERCRLSRISAAGSEMRVADADRGWCSLLALRLAALLRKAVCDTLTGTRFEPSSAKVSDTPPSKEVSVGKRSHAEADSTSLSIVLTSTCTVRVGARARARARARAQHPILTLMHSQGWD